MLGAKKAGAWLAVGACFLAVPTVSTAVQRALTVTKQATIVDPAGLSRVLLQFDPIDDLQGEWISSATLHVPLKGVALKEDLDLQIDVPKTAWDAAATWSGPWTKPGGDPHDTQAVEWTLSAGRGGTTLAVDVTNLVRAIQTGDMPDNGFLIWPAAVAQRAGFTATDLAGLGALSTATIDVTYRKITARSKVGAREILARRAAGRID